MSTLSPDKPLTDPNLDKLGYAHFAEMLAKSILEMIPPQGLVMAIYGEWGLGKSTCVEFIVHYLEELTKGVDEDITPIIVRFNPWWFSGNEALIRHFFDEIQIAFSRKFHNTVTDLVEGIQKISKVVAEVPVPGAGIAGAIAQSIPNINDRDLLRLKDDVSDKLAKQKRRIVIVIDDIDRLSPEEIRQLFTIIKAVADFSNVVYLLAFDEEVVTSALGERGADYLEKIVQVPFKLPIPSKDKVIGLLFEHIESIVGEIPSRMRRNELWNRESELRAIYDIVDTPRKVIRLANVLTVTYPTVKGEVDITDFIAIEAVRLFDPDVYDEVRPSKTLLTGIALGRSDSGLLTSITSKSKTPELMESLLKALFPESVRTGGIYGYKDQYIKEMRICVPQMFDTYFRLNIADDEVSSAETNAVLSAANAQDLVSNLLEFAATNPRRITALFRRISYLSDETIPLEQAGPIITAIFEVGDKFLNLKPKRPFQVEDENFIYMFTIVQNLLARFERSQQFGLINDAISMGNADLFAIRFIIVVEQGYSRFGNTQYVRENDKLITETDLAKLEALALPKIKRLITNSDFMQHPKRLTVLHVWIELEHEAAKMWLKQALENQGDLVEFVRLFVDFPSHDVVIISEGLETFVDLPTLTELLGNVIKQKQLPPEEVGFAEIVLPELEKKISNS